jgi:glycolate oxidase FAD binding subunit
VRSGSLLHVATLAAKLEDLLGQGRVSMRPRMHIQRVRPRVEVRPADMEQLAAVLAMADKEGLAVCVAGGGSKLGWGNPPVRFDVLLQTADLPKYCEVDADDLIMTVSSGVTVAEARAAARAKGRVLPLDARLPARATVAGAAVTADQGPRGAGYGAVRDVVLGLRAVLVDGTTVHFGGRTMKNVAGYDMTKLFVGSFGCLGVVTEVTIRLLPCADSEALVLLPLPTLRQGGEIAAWLLDSPLTPLALMCVGGRLAAQSGGPMAAASATVDGGGVLVAGFTGAAPAVQRSVEEMCFRAPGTPATLVSGPEECERVYGALDFLAGDCATGADETGGVLEARASVPVSRVWTLAEEIESLEHRRDLTAVCRVDAARGVLDLRLAGEPAGDTVALLRSRAVSLGGQLTLTAGTERLPPEVDAWGVTGPSLKLVANVKARFDPRGTLNPGRFVGGI